MMDGQGQVSDAYAFDAWGNALTSPQSQVPNPFKYVGKHGYYWDTESALMLLGVRYYAGSMGRFLSMDPAMPESNFYAYASLNPATSIDPTGLWDSDEVHFKCTFQWASEVFRPLGQGFAVLRAPNLIAWGARILDFVAPPFDFFGRGIWTGWHFNFSAPRGDLRRWRLGLPAPLPDTRENFFFTQFARAIQLCWTGLWQRGSSALGLGLHSLQDIRSRYPLP